MKWRSLTVSAASVVSVRREQRKESCDVQFLLGLPRKAAIGNGRDLAEEPRC